MEHCPSENGRPGAQTALILTRLRGAIVEDRD